MNIKNKLLRYFILYCCLWLGGEYWLCPAVAQQYAGSKTTTFTTSVADTSVNLTSSGITLHQLTWRTIGTVSGCSVKLEKSTDNASWSDLIGVQTCTSTGSATLTSDTTANYIRINTTSFTGTGSIIVTWIGYNQALGVGNYKTLNNIRFADQFSGSDIGAQINAAYADLPSTGGRIVVAGTAASFSTPIVIGTSGKPAKIECLGNGNILTYTGAGSTVAITFNYGGASAPQFWHAGLDNCFLTGPSDTGSTIAILAGGTNGAAGLSLNRVNVTGFGEGFKASNNTYWTTTNSSFFHDNAINIDIPNGLTNSGESISITDSSFVGAAASFTNCIKLAAGSSTISIKGGNIDDCQVAVSSGALISLDEIAFENPGLHTSDEFIKISGGSIVLHALSFLQDATVPTMPAAITCSGGSVHSESVSAFNGGSAIAVYLADSGTCLSRIINQIQYGGFTALSSGFVTALHIDTNTLLLDHTGSNRLSIDVNGTATYKNFWNPTADVYNVAGDFTTANNTNLQTITGLTWTLPASTVLNVPFSCRIAYSQATGTAAVSFGMQSATINPTSILAKGEVFTNTTVTTEGNVTITDTTATAIVTATPSAITTIWNANLDGFIENPSNASTNVINIMVKTATGADAVTIKRGSFCRIF